MTAHLTVHSAPARLASHGLSRNIQPASVFRRRRRLRAPFLLAVALGAGLAGSLGPEPARVAHGQLLAPPTVTTGASAHVVARSYSAMGTDVTLSAFTADETAAVNAFGAAIAEIRRLEALMTDWPHEGQPPSDVLRINAAAGHEAVVVSDETFEVVAFSLDISKRSGGAFDVTYAAMRGLWKFDDDLVKKVPPAAEIARRRKLINWRDVILDKAAKTVKLRREGMRLGLGGIAKGYAVDRAARVMRDSGFADFMVQAGGDLYIAGQKGTANWMVGVRDPRDQKEVIAKMPIKDHAFSTAGDYERSFILDGKRYHHIIDPKTGYPATASREVTVFAPNAFLADAIDDAIFILGPQKGLALCAQFPDTAALVVDAHNKVWMSPALQDKLTLTREPRDAL